MEDEKDVNSLLKIIKEEVTSGVLVFGDLETVQSFVEQIKLAQPNLALSLTDYCM